MRKYIIFIFALLIVGMFYLSFSKEKYILNYDIINQLQTGDLALIEGDSYKSDIVKMIDGQNNYSHIGFIVKDDNNVYIVHMSIDTGFIEWENIEDYIINNKVSNIDFYRLNSYVPKDKIYKLLEDFKVEQVEFDYSFNHKNVDRLYCSELIIVVLSKLGYNIPIERNKRYIYPSELTRNEISYKIFN